VEAAGAGVEFHAAACPRFVEFVERGQTGGAELIVAHEYLSPLIDAGIDTLILGCTHYPLLSGVISFVMGPEVVLISSAEEVARDVFAVLTQREWTHDPAVPSAHRFLSSGDPALFEELGTRFLGPEIAKVEERAWS
jgi:glutamate racemase